MVRLLLDEDGLDGPALVKRFVSRATHQRKNEQHQEDQEENSGDRGSGARNDTEAECARDEGDDQKDEGVA